MRKNIGSGKTGYTPHHRNDPTAEAAMTAALQEAALKVPKRDLPRVPDMALAVRACTPTARVDATHLFCAVHSLWQSIHALWPSTLRFFGGRVRIYSLGHKEHSSRRG